MVGMGSVTRSVPPTIWRWGTPRAASVLPVVAENRWRAHQESCEDISGLLACVACGLGYNVRNGRHRASPVAIVAAYARDNRPSALLHSDRPLASLDRHLNGRS